MLYVIIIQELTGYCYISHKLFSRIITNWAKSLTNHFLRSWQVELSTWVVKIWNQPIQKRSCFWYRKICSFNLLLWGLNFVLRYLMSSVLRKFHGPGMCRNRPGIIPMLATTFLSSVYISWDDISPHFPDYFWHNLSSNKAQTVKIVIRNTLILYAIKIICIYINEQVVSIFSYNLRSDSELGRCHLSW